MSGQDISIFFVPDIMYLFKIVTSIYWHNHMKQIL